MCSLEGGSISFICAIRAYTKRAALEGLCPALQGHRGTPWFDSRSVGTIAMTALESAKQRLPLPELMAQLGLGDHAKKSARCPFHADANASFSMFQKRNGNWAWKCHGECGVGGDEADFIAKHEGLTDSGDACRRYIELAGVQGNGPGARSRGTVSGATRRSSVTRVPEKEAVLLSMSVEEFDAWREGLEFIKSRPETAGELEEDRGWDRSDAQFLIDCRIISMPLFFRKEHKRWERGYAFLVKAPLGTRDAMVSVPVGWHIRLRNKDGGKTWRYKPTGNRSLPFILGDFGTAHTLIILEGNWDALTFAFAAGWLGEQCLWPKGVGVIGIRGAENTGAFLECYRSYWPHNANCLVLPDNDSKGEKWYMGERTFVSELSKLCHKVAVVKCGRYKDFNELYEHERIGPSQITELLTSHGISLGNEVMA